jgi:hypothetical protein
MTIITFDSIINAITSFLTSKVCASVWLLIPAAIIVAVAALIIIICICAVLMGYIQDKLSDLDRL